MFRITGRIFRVRSSRAISKGLEGSKLDLNFNIFKFRNTFKICYMFSGVKYTSSSQY